MKYIKVAYVTHYKALYGANRSLLELMNEMPKSNILPHVVMPDYGNGSLPDVLSQMGIPFHQIRFHNWYHPSVDTNVSLSKKYRRWVLSVKSLLRNLISLIPLLLKLSNWRIDIVHTNSIVTPIGFWASSILRKPHIWHIRELIDIHYSQSPDLGYFLTQKTIKQSDSIIAVSKAVKDHYFQDNLVPQFQVIYDGVNVDKGMRKDRDLSAEIAHSEFVFLLLGALHPRKGIEIAISAISRIIQDNYGVKLLIAGKGSPHYEQKCRDFVNKLSLVQHVKFLGFVDDPFKIFLSANALLMCSEFEAFGRVTLEAMSVGLPVIGNASGGTPELIKHEYNGLLYNGELEDLVVNMKKAINSPELLKNLSLNAIDFSSQFSVDNTALEIVMIYRSLVENHGISTL